MPGIVDQQVKKPPVANAAPAMSKGAPATAQADPVVTRIEIAAKKILADPKSAQQFVQMMKAAGDPAKGIAQVTVLLMRHLFTASKKTMPLQALMPAAQKVVVDVARVGAGAKLFKLTPDIIRQAAEQVFQIMQQAAKAKQAQQQQAPAAQPEQPAAAPSAPPPVAAAAAPQPGA